MVMAVGSVRMAVLNLFCTGSAHVCDLDIKAETFACERMVAIQIDGIALDFEHGKDDPLTLVIGGFELTADFDAGGEL